MKTTNQNIPNYPKMANVTKDGHVLHAFTERDTILLTDETGEVRDAPLFFDYVAGAISYCIGKTSYLLPEYYQPYLSII